jgi:Mor family transcriptional regulator
MNLEHYPEELERVFAKISDLLVERDVAPTQADEAGFLVVEFIRREWGGIAVYFRKKRESREEGLWNQDPLFLLPAPAATPDSNDYHAQLTATATEILERLGLDGALGAVVADLVRDDWGGNSVYVNRGVSYETLLRDYQIWREWNGSHLGKIKLLKKYRISDAWFYKIIKRVRQREFRRTQPVLPFGSAQDEPGMVGE